METPESALNEFFSECEEILQRFSAGLSQVERKEGDIVEVIGALYRDMHTLKGSAQLFGFLPVAQVAHAMEAALEPMRRLKITIPHKLVDVLFKCVDLIERILKETNRKGPSGATSYAVEIGTLVPLLISEASDSFGGEYFLVKESFTVSEGNIEFSKKINQSNIINKETKSICVSEQVISESTATQQLGEIVVEKGKNSEETLLGAINTATKDDAPSAVSDSNSTVRIPVVLLDKLMNLVGEMVLVRNQVLQYSQKNDDLDFLNLSQKLDLVTSELQGEVMKTRMQPIGSILSKFQRVVRDLGKDLGKQIELTVQGSETELDKTLLEAIKDPLTHIIRNSCDHGIESSDERTKSGKPPVGHVRICAYHEGGQVIIDVSDDGKGLNYQRILDKAIEKKIISPETAKSLGEREIGHLIFSPGFSTADQVSAVSGRGVGMDVVKTNLEKVGGQIELHSVYQKGMTLRMRIPLTLAIVPALIVRVGKEQFAIPQIKLAELVRVENDGNGQKIEFLQGKPVFRLRGRLLSLVNLSEVLKLEVESTDQIEKKYTDSVNIVVLNGEGDTFGLVVDEIKDTADIVVKPLSQFLKRLATYSGATIMGDGTVSLILDITGIAQKANLFQKSSKKDFGTESALQNREGTYNSEIQDFLFFRLHSSEIYCLPLCLVNRLEEFSNDQIEYSGAQRMVKYRGSILPLISLNHFLGLEPAPDGQKPTEGSSVIVVQKTGRYFGIEVNEVVDISSVKGSVEEPIKEIPGILGSIIVGEEVATVVDVLGVLNSVLGTQSDKSAINKDSTEEPKSLVGKVLFAEDTVFFMKQVKRVVESLGLKVVHVPDGAQAWQTLEAAKPGEFQLLLTDIEMPNMTGFELAQKVRSETRFANLPMIALTTRFSDTDIEKGKRFGFTYYLEKLKSDQLISVLEIIFKESKKS